MKWIRGAQDFWDAVEKARYLPQRPLPEPPKPEKRAGHDHLRAAELHEWDRKCVRVRIANDNRIAEVVAIKPFMS